MNDLGSNAPAVGRAGGKGDAAQTIVAEYTTWGSYGQFFRRLVVLRDGRLVDPATMRTREARRYR